MQNDAVAVVYAFIDASNLFYGGEKSLGWKIDYEKLLAYLNSRYGVSKAFFYGGIDIHKYKHDYLNNHSICLAEVKRHLASYISANQAQINEADLALLSRHLKKTKFYEKLEQFGYILRIKPVKIFARDDGAGEVKKANCDVDMAFELMKESVNFSSAIILSGDGDFLPVLKHLKSQGKEIVILARGGRTAREIKQFAGAGFRDFMTLRELLEFKDKKTP